MCKENIPIWTITFFLFGSDKTHEKQMGHKPGDKIYINRYWHLGNRQNEFVCRIFIYDLLILFANHWLSSKLGNIIWLNLFQKMGIILLEWVACWEIIYYLFKRKLIGYDKNDFSTMKKLFTPITRAHIVALLINIFDVCHKNIALTIILELIVSIMLLYLLYKKRKKLEGESILCIISQDDYGIDTGIELENAIVINMKNGDKRFVNLLSEDFYIKNNDDILIVKRNEKPTLYRKEFIKNIASGNDMLTYDGEKWKRT